MKLMLPNKSEWEKEPSFIKALGLEVTLAPIISFVGAGGKTTTIEYLAKEYEKLNRNVIITTTTHMYKPEKWAWCEDESMETVDRFLKQEKVLWIGVPCGEEKIMSPQPDFLERLMLRKIPMLVEADGSRRLPFKVPGEREPVILDGSHMVVGVLGMDALGRPMKEVCFRSELAAEYLKKTEEELITVDDYINVINSKHGLRKGVTKEKDFVVILNKVDDKNSLNRACLIRDILKKQDVNNVFLTSYL